MGIFCWSCFQPAHILQQWADETKRVAAKLARLAIDDADSRSPAWINKDQFAADDAIRKVQEREEQRRKDFDCQQRLFMKGFYHYIHYQRPIKTMAKRMNERGDFAGKESLVDQIYYASDVSQVTCMLVLRLIGRSSCLMHSAAWLERSDPRGNEADRGAACTSAGAPKSSDQIGQKAETSHTGAAAEERRGASDEGSHRTQSSCANAL